MGIPASQIPAQHSYCIHGFGKPGLLAWETAVDATGALLESAKVFMRTWEKIDFAFADPEFGNAPLIALEWDSSLERELVSSSLKSLTNDSLLIAMICQKDLKCASADSIRIPDLWLVCDESRSPKALVEEWSAAGAGAVAAFGWHGEASWISGNAAFGNSEGSLKKSFQAFSDMGFGFFASGILYALIDELLGESLFEKTSPRLDRECLEMRPLHLTPAIEAGLAAASIHADRSPAYQNAVKQHNFLLGRLRAILRSWRGPESLAWGGRGR